MINTPMSNTSHSHHRHRHSGELDVFEATRYFSGAADAHETIARRAMRGDRRSLDMPPDARAPPQPHQRVVDQLMTHNKVKCKQPSSPGGKLARFLNNFFLQHSNSKKSKKSSPPPPPPPPSSSKLVKGDHKDQEREREKRTSMHESKSCYYSSCSSDVGFRTPSLNTNSKKRTSEGFKDELNVNKKDDKLEEDELISDASSDLFELKIDLYEFGEIDSSGLPVHGSADHVGVIRSTRERFASTIAY